MALRTSIPFICAAVGSLLVTSCDEILISIQSPSDGSTVISSTVPLYFSIAGASGSVAFSCKLDAAPARPCSPDDTFTEVPDGRHSITVNAADATGLRGTKTVAFNVDTRDTQPTAVIDSPANGATLTSASVSVAFSIVRGLPGDKILCGLDSGPRIECTSPHVFSNVPDGLHSITVSANSPGGFSTFDRTTVLVNTGSASPIAVQQVSAGGYHTCALLVNGKVRCWGNNGNGQLGYGNFDDVSQAVPASLGDVNVGGEVIQIATGAFHTCALLRGGSVRCWGDDSAGQLGYNRPDAYVGGREIPANAGDVNVGASVAQVTAGDRHTCALLQDGNVRCWGDNTFGTLGYGNTQDLRSKPPADAGNVNVGGRVVQIEAGQAHTCALLSGGNVRCWGYGNLGELGYPNIDKVGDDETPAQAGDVSVGGPVTQIAAGGHNTCALLSSGQVRCWGWAPAAGDVFPSRVGDDELPSSVPAVNVGGSVLAIDAGGTNTNALMCALLTTGAVRCWGIGGAGTLGYERPGTDLVRFEDVAGRGDIRVGRPVRGITTGGQHTCALVDGGVLRCWGRNSYGQLGYGNQLDIGDDEPPSSAGDVLVGFNPFP